jgi:hypothetical protein
MKNVSVAFALVVSVGIAHAGCWRVANMAGPAVFASDKYQVTQDGYSAKFASDVFEVNTEQRRPYVTGHADMACRAPSSTTVVCEGGAPGYVMATWTIDAGAGVATHLKLTTGYGSFDGVRMFIGKVVGKC